MLVVGGGITGAGVALDAVSRGLRTALVERDDFASGTSSRSSKLVHGGLRYLDQREFRLVYEALAERQRIIENAPHLVSILPFLVPVLRSGGRIDRRLAPVLGGALWMYDLTGGLRIGRRHRRVSADEALAHIPTLDRSQLARGYVYFDAQADDARLTLAIARTAAAHGAVVANHAGVTAFEKHDGTVVGAHVSADGEDLTVRARVVVNASGVWADDVRALDEGAHPASMQPAKGVHITLPWSMVRNQIAAIVPAPDGERMVFVIPWGDHTYVGTTDTTYDGAARRPALHARRRAVPPRRAQRCHRRRRDGRRRRRHLGRPAPPAPRRVATPGPPISRGATPSGSAPAAWSPSPAGSSPPTAAWRPTRSTPRCGRSPASTCPAPPAGSDWWAPTGWNRHAVLPLAGGTVRTPSTTEHLASRYGSEASAVAALAHEQPAWKDPLVPGLPYLKAEAVFAVREEMARTLDDVLSRRTRARILDRRASVDAAPAVAELLAGELEWSTSERDAEVTALPRPGRGRPVLRARGRRTGRVAAGLAVALACAAPSALAGAASTTPSRAWPPLPTFDTSLDWAPCGDGWECATLTVPTDWTPDQCRHECPSR